MSVKYCLISPNSIVLQAYYVTVVEDRPTCISFSTFDQNCPILQRGLSGMDELLVFIWERRHPVYRIVGPSIRGFKNNIHLACLGIISVN